MEAILAALAARHLAAAIHGVDTFEGTYRCLPPSYAANPNLEDGDKLLLPASALHRLATLRVEYAMLFELRAAASGNAAADPDDHQPQQRATHCGVLEFVATEGTVVKSRWMMANLRLDEGDLVHVRSATALPKGTYVKLQPHTSAFLDVSNPKAVLEKTLRTYTCLTTGDTIMVSYNGKSYYIDIVETRPAAAVCIIETDCEVDFAPPLDNKEPEKPPVRLPVAPAVAPASSKAKAPADDGAVVKDEPKFKAFSGSGKRLDGKASAPQAAASQGAASAVASSAAAASTGSNNGGGNKQQQASAPAATSGASSSGRQKTGKLVFGSSSGTSKSSNSKEEPQKAPVKQQVQEPQKTKDEPKFQAFTGKSYSLKR
ncbi:unnamed protein product [Urochloa humidicola]